MIDLQALKLLCEKATPGPWVKPAEGYSWTFYSPDSIAFIAFARTALPALIAEVERLAFLHRQDHSLADQWEAKNQKLETNLALAKEALEKILLRKDACCGGLECACHDDAQDALAQLEGKP